MFSITEFLNLTLGTKEFFLVTGLISLICKFFLISILIYFYLQKSLRKPIVLLMIFMFGSIISDLTDITYLLLRKIFEFNESHVLNLIYRSYWIFFITQHTSLGLFLEYLTDRKIKFKFNYWLILAINLCFSSVFLYFSVIMYGQSSNNTESLAIESMLIQIGLSTLFLIFIPTLYRTIKKIRSNQLPNILNKQLKIFVGLIISYLFIELINNKYSVFYFIGSFMPLKRYALLSVSTLLSSYGIYFAIKNMMGLRFLNFKKQVEAPMKFNFIDDFKNILEQFSHMSTIKELALITQAFFKAAFNIPNGRARFYTRKNNKELSDIDDIHPDLIAITDKVENFIVQYSNSESKVNQVLYESKILIRDEIEFTNFYDESQESITIIAFLESINADIFLPIYERNIITGYIIVEKNARINQLYSNIETDEMLVFTSYMSNIIKIFNQGNLNALYQAKKELEEELYQKHQEITQYKESIRSFFRNGKDRKIGIILYKNRKYAFANQAAQDLFNIDLNNNDGHPIVQALKQLTRKVQEFKSPQTIFAKDNLGSKIILSGIPSLESSNIIITVYYPEVSDIMKTQYDLLKDPSDWDYLLYLETTKSGQLINQLIPGSSETLLNFKINLLETALSRKATLLQMPEDDLIPTVEILNHISLRQNLHTIKLNAPEKNNEVALKLFGINPIFGNAFDEALLKKLDNIGTIFIQNIDFLSIETQNKLAEYILYGYFYQLKSDNKLFSSVRIIGSTFKNLQDLVAENQFSKTLFAELKKTSLIMPSLNNLPKEEMVELTDGFTQLALKTQTFKNLLDFSEKEKHKLFDSGAISLQELKSKVQQMVVHKSTKHNIHDTIEFDSYATGDPELASAIKLGKKALKDPQVLAFLWQKFKNQNKIATLLGVNRSSVNRRCQEFNIY